MLWTYEKPTKQGWYKVNCGDVATPDSISFVYFVHDKPSDVLYDRAGGESAHMYNDIYKFMPVDFDELNRVGNE